MPPGGVDRELERALDSHELIKVKLGNVEDELQAEMIAHITASGRTSRRFRWPRRALGSRAR